MAGSTYNIDVTQLEGLSKRMDSIASFTQDNYPMFFGLAEIMKRQAGDKFESQSDGKGHAWPALSESTLKKRGKKGGARRAALGSDAAQGGSFADKMLRDSGRLFASIMARMPIISDSTVEIGTNVIYSRIHNLGGMAGRGQKVSIPQRQYLVITEENKKELGAYAQRYFAAAARKGLGS